MLKSLQWMCLLALVACATPKSRPVEVKDPAGDPGESDARMVSPYSAEPCICMKIYQPVCAKGITYGNSCEAECQGHSQWQEGACKR
jgi:hypothetical protein